MQRTKFPVVNDLESDQNIKTIKEIITIVLLIDAKCTAASITYILRTIYYSKKIYKYTLRLPTRLEYGWRSATLFTQQTKETFKHIHTIRQFSPRLL